MDSSDIGAFVETFLDGEKEATRRLIRHEMKSMIDPLVEALFGQLKAKFVDYADAAKCQDSQLWNHVRDDNGRMIQDQETMHFNAQQYHSQSLPIDSLDNFNHSIDANCQINSTNNHKPALMSIKEEINDPLNEFQFEPQMNDPAIINSSSSVHEPSSFPKSIIPSNLTDELPNTEMQQQQLVNIKHHQFDEEEECECDECAYGGIEVKEEEKDDDHESVQRIYDNQADAESSPPDTKRPRIDTTQNQINAQTVATTVSQSPKQPTDESQPNLVNKQFITVHLQCLQAQCPDTFQTEDQLNRHMLDVHFLEPFRCAAKDCSKSFDNSIILDNHIKKSHQNITQWHCDKCAQHFHTYVHLSYHYNLYHQLGLFQCAYPACTFTGDHRVKVYFHNIGQHKRVRKCQQSDCNFLTSNQDLLKTHERTHFSQPYRCKLPRCRYASAQKGHAMTHIRFHLSRNANSDQNGAQLDPKDYLEVVHDLL